MKKLLFFSFFLILFCASCGDEVASSESTEAREVKIIYTDWSEGVAISYLVKNVLADKLDYNVILKLADLNEIYPSVASGEYDLFLDAWLPVTHEGYFEKYKDKIYKAGLIYEGAEAGLVVPDYVEEQSLSDLKNPTIYGIDSSSGVVQNTIKAAKAYGFTPEIHTGSEAIMVKMLEDGYKRRNPVVVTGWTPHQMFSKYNLRFLKDDKKIFGDSEKIYAVGNKENLESDPILKAFFGRFQLSDRQISKLIREVLNNPEGEDAGAKAWIAKNRIIVSRWTKNLSEFEEKAL